MKNSKIKCDVCHKQLYYINTEEYIDYQIRKGWIKPEDKNMTILANVLWSGHHPFYCKKCDQLFSFFATIGKALFTVEPLPEAPMVRGFIKKQYTKGEACVE